MTDVLTVSFGFSPGKRIPIGRLALDENDPVFEYDGGFASSGLSLNPAFPIAPGLLRARNPRAFRGLHGVFADSLPDAWGELLLDRRLRHANVSISAITVLDRLAFVGKSGRGALVFEPPEEGDGGTHAVDLDRLAKEADEVFDGNEDDFLREIERLGGSSGGARPKVQVALDDSGHARTDEDSLPPNFTSWIVKFHCTADRFSDIGPLEAAYAEAARRAGISMPRTRLIQSKTGPGYFATERFDRKPGGERVHMLSIAGLLDVEWSAPAIDYETLFAAIRRFTRNELDVLEMFRRMVFNVVARNRDDHAKQHALLMDSKGRWRLSPAYDLTLASGPGNEHYLAINGKGTDVTRRDLIAVGEGVSIAVHRANAIIDEVTTVVATVPSIAADFGVTRLTRNEIALVTAQSLALVKT